MTAKGPAGAATENALAFRDALFSLRQMLPAPAEDQKRIDAAVAGVLEADFKAGKLRQGRHSLDKMLTAIGTRVQRHAGARARRADAPYAQAAELLAKVGDEGGPRARAPPR